MKYNVRKYLWPLSLGINLFFAFPAMVIFVSSSTIRFDLYQQHLAHRLGRPEIVFIGDSITLGGKIWAFRIGEYNFNVWNYGYGGMTTRQIQYYARKTASQKATRYAFVMAGINDDDKTIDGANKSFADYKVIIDTLLDAGITPIIELTLYRENEKSPEYVDRLNELLIKYSKQRRLNVIDLNLILAPEKSLLPKYSKDGVHLTEAAYDVWSEKVKGLLKKMRSEQVVAPDRQETAPASR